MTIMKWIAHLFIGVAYRKGSYVSRAALHERWHGAIQGVCHRAEEFCFLDRNLAIE
jgi:hypothetical protein